MRRAGLGTAALLLAGCGPSQGNTGVPTATATADARSVTPAPAPANPQRQIGSVSGLTGVQSGLKGLVTGFAVERTATATVATLAADTLFEFDRATLTPAARGNLQRTAALVQQGGAGKVTVIGYTDAKGEDAYNLALSRRRAEAVVAWLRGPGGAADREFVAVGKGEAEPVASNNAPDGGDDPAGRAQNRRVVVSIPR